MSKATSLPKRKLQPVVSIDDSHLEMNNTTHSTSSTPMAPKNTTNDTARKEKLISRVLGLPKMENGMYQVKLKVSSTVAGKYKSEMTLFDLTEEKLLWFMIRLEELENQLSQ